MQKYTDEELIAIIRLGTPKERDKALHYIFVDFGIDTTVRKWYRANCKGLPKKNDEDFANDVFIILERRIRLGGYIPAKNVGNGLKGYFFKICVNHLKNLLNPDRNGSIGFSTDEPPPDPIDPKTPDLNIFKKKCQEIVHALLDQLGPKCKEALLLYYLGYSRREIQEKMGFVTEEAAGAKIFRCRREWYELFEKNPHLKKDADLKDCWEPENYQNE